VTHDAFLEPSRRSVLRSSPSAYAALRRCSLRVRRRGAGRRPLAAPLPVAYRLIPGQHGWWCLASDEIVLLPAWAATSDRKLRRPFRVILRRPRLSQALDASDPFFLTVYTTAACNLACPYCFQHLTAAGDQTAPKRIQGANLDPRTVERVLAFARRRMAESGRKQLEIMLFGGEPLLNPKGCLRLLRQARTLGLRGAAIVTNGTLLDPGRLRELVGAGLSVVQVTFDGGQDDHDRLRVRRSGGGTFEEICERLAACRQVEGVHWQIRVNVSHRNRDSIDELIETLVHHVSLERTSITIALVNDVGIGFTNHVGYRDADLFRAWHLHALEAGFQPTLPTPPRTCATCSAEGGGTGAVVSSTGDLFSCWDTVGRDAWRVGDVDHGYDPALVRERWVSCDHRVAAHGTDAEAQSFADVVDGGILDWLYDHGKLETLERGFPVGAGAMH
jgi:uncharacterized protein